MTSKAHYHYQAAIFDNLILKEMHYRVRNNFDIMWIMAYSNIVIPWSILANSNYISFEVSCKIRLERGYIVKTHEMPQNWIQHNSGDIKFAQQEYHFDRLWQNWCTRPISFVFNSLGTAWCSGDIHMYVHTVFQYVQGTRVFVCKMWNPTIIGYGTFTIVTTNCFFISCSIGACRPAGMYSVSCVIFHRTLLLKHFIFTGGIGSWLVNKINLKNTVKFSKLLFYHIGFCFNWFTNALVKNIHAHTSYIPYALSYWYENIWLIKIWNLPNFIVIPNFQRINMK